MFRSHMRALSALFAVLFVFGAASLPSLAAPGGNSENAHRCQKLGWQSLARMESPSVAFTNQDECVSYGAQGGTIVDWVSDVRCLNNGFYEWRTTDGGRFTTSDECLAYVAGGGTLAAPIPHIEIVDQGFSNGQCTVQAWFRDFPVGSSWRGREYINGNWVFDFGGGAFAPYGDSQLSPRVLAVGDIYMVEVYRASFPVQSVTFTCQAPAT